MYAVIVFMSILLLLAENLAEWRKTACGLFGRENQSGESSACAERSPRHFYSSTDMTTGFVRAFATHNKEKG